MPVLVIYPGTRSYPLVERVAALPLVELSRLAEELAT